MIRLKDLVLESSTISEKTGQEVLASKIAKKMGLVSKGWGRWADPQTGKIVAKTIDDKLVRVEPSDDTEPTNSADNFASAGSEKRMARKLDPKTTKAPEQMNRFQRNKATYDKFANHILKNGDNLEGPEYEKAGSVLRKIISTRPDVDVDPELVNDGFSPKEMAQMYKFIDDTATGQGGFSIDVYDRKTDRDGVIEVDTLDHSVWNNVQFDARGDWSYIPEPVAPDYDPYDGY